MLLKDQVQSIVKTLEGINTDWHELCEDPECPGAYDYLSDVLDIEYIVSSDKRYLGARVLVAFGGPNIWINTRNNQVEGYWWQDSYTERFDDEIGLDEALEELYECQ